LAEPAAFKDFCENECVNFLDEVRRFLFRVGFFELINDVLVDLLSLNGESIENVFKLGKCVVFRLDNLVVVSGESLK
jgi:hypothetical protein